MGKMQKNTMTMLEYCKVLLSKLSFDQELIEKEYRKGLKYLSSNDQAELKQWLRINGMKID